ncbi:hypothetical protein [Rhodococcus sp. T7]|uniref:hypothetical protein n=1 Tax=Rhodococcus sp. T7 TaxID=627444 RepID=UPI00135C8D36|nr:hypothetical protein [Rhodococcus sp. T7]
MAKILEDGDRPWFGSEAERRALFDQRYQAPQPPALSPVHSLRTINNPKENN